MRRNAIWVSGLVLLAVGCAASSTSSTRTGYGETVEQRLDGVTITRGEALVLGKRQLSVEPFSKAYESGNAFIRYNETLRTYTVDFRHLEAQAFEPESWTKGYKVVIDTDTGAILRAHAYEREEHKTD